MSRRDVVVPEEGEIFDIELDENILRKNEELARENRELLDARGIRAIDVMGSIGSGKTTFLEKVVDRLKGRHGIAVVNGDLTTTIDSDLIERHGVKVIQVHTGKECHLDANLVKKSLSKLDLEDVDLLFIENVGNLICPAEFPLGAHDRVVVTSVTEGPHMVKKHPYIFAEAAVVALNKIDLAEAMDVDPQEIERDVLRVNPDAKVVPTNCRTGEGIDRVVDALGL
jgi:hydrogenase nickel incorporation protein HypB